LIEAVAKGASKYKFWFRFISDAKPLIEQELYEEVFNSMIEPFLSQYAGIVFEEVCIQYLKKLNGKNFYLSSFLKLVDGGGVIR